MGIAIIIGFILLVVGALIWYSIVTAKKRRLAFETLAAQLGWSYEYGPFAPGAGLLAPAVSFDLFNQGRSRKVNHWTRGRAEDADVQLFDYQYTTGYGKSQSTPMTTVVLLTAPSFPAGPAFYLYPETIFSKVATAFGGQDIDFPQFPQFSKMFMLKSADEAGVRAMIDPPMAGFLEQHKGITVQSVGNHLVFYRAGRLTKRDDLRAVLDEAVLTFRTVAAAASRVGR